MSWHVEDETVERDRGPLLGSEHPFKLAVFGLNDNRGLVMTTADGPPEATWEESKRIAQWADRLGFEAMVPLARWRGYGGDLDLGSRVFETFTWAAGIAAVTERIQVMATFLVPTVHPILAAKMAVTVDHISHGRAGLNIVSGWHPEEIGMFGAPQREHDERYDVAAEWTDLVQQLWTTEGEFDFEGRFFKAPRAFLEPKPIQKPRPVLMSAGISPAGRKFAASYADVVFVAIADPAATRETVAEVKRYARDHHGKDIKVFGRAHITCRDTEAEAQAAYRHFIVDGGDKQAGENVLKMLMGNSFTIDYDSLEHQGLVEAVIRGYFAHPVTGTPEQVVEQLSELAEAGLDGVAITWNDYDEGLRQFEESILGLMVTAGLRASVPAATPA